MTTGPLRIFVAVYPPPDAASSLVHTFNEQGLQGVRTVQPDHVHMTVQFIGDTARSELERVQESVARSVSGLEPALLVCRRIASSPSRRPHLAAALFEPNPTISELHRRLAIRLARPRARGERAFAPHMTLARYKAGVHHALAVALPAPVSFRVHEAVLVSSVLRPGGAEHAPLERFPLG